jgi:large subunit ribosomal protein L10
MAITKDKKTEIIDQLSDLFGRSKSVIFADFRGLTVKEVETLRANLRAKNVVMKVAKKTLIKLAASKNGYDQLPDDASNVPVAAVFSLDDEVAAAATLHEFAKTNENLKLVAAFLDGKILATSETISLAKIPPFEVLIAKFMGSMTAPVAGFQGTLTAVTGGFVRAMNAYREQKEQQA